MTIICYRDGVLAADRMCSASFDLIHGYHKKICEQDGTAWASSGAIQECMAFDQWVRTGRSDRNKPSLSDDKDTSLVAILIERDGTVKHYNYNLVPFTMEAPYFAIGNGDMVAYGAMFMGASAEEAVRAACAHVLGCGGGIDVLRLSQPAQPHEASPTPASQVI